MTPRGRRAKLAGRLGPSPAVNHPWFLAWSLYHFVGSPGGYLRPPFPNHLTTAENPGVFDEWARLTLWRQRKRAGVTHPAVGLWVGGRLPPWAITVSSEMDKHSSSPKPPDPTPDPNPVPHNPNATIVNQAQNVLFTAWRPGDGLRANHGKLAITADVNVAGNAAEHIALAKDAASRAKGQGRLVSAWANQSQVGIDNVRRFAGEIGADYIIWQAETAGEMADVGILMDGSMRPGSPLLGGPLVLVGNANSWTLAQRWKAAELDKEGRLALIQEMYTNCGDPWPEAYGTGGVPARAVCVGVGWDRFPYQLPEYKQHTPAGFWPTLGAYLAEDFDASSWGLWP